MSRLGYNRVRNIKLGVNVFVAPVSLSLVCTHVWSSVFYSGGMTMWCRWLTRRGACVSRTPRARLYSAEWFISSLSCECGWRWGRVRQLVRPREGACVCVFKCMWAHMLTRVCLCVWRSEWLPRLIHSGSLWSWIDTLALSLLWPCRPCRGPWRAFCNSRMKRKHLAELFFSPKFCTVFFKL